MQSSWRVACVRIPRFPIGAGWREARVVPGPPAATAATPNSPASQYDDKMAPQTISTGQAVDFIDTAMPAMMLVA